MPCSTSGKLASAIDALLPQTQCTRCGYPACRPYAEAIASGDAPINRCPPGGQAGIDALARLMNQPADRLDPGCGTHGPRLLATIEPGECIGCTKCILACPVDAIIGGPQLMHTVLPSLCSGCELCVPPCPVDCIRIEPVSAPWSDEDADAARARFNHREKRRQTADADGSQPDDSNQLSASAPASDPGKPQKEAPADQKRRLVAAAMARARARQNRRGQKS